MSCHSYESAVTAARAFTLIFAMVERSSIVPHANLASLVPSPDGEHAGSASRSPRSLDRISQYTIDVLRTQRCLTLLMSGVLSEDGHGYSVALA